MKKIFLGLSLILSVSAMTVKAQSLAPTAAKQPATASAAAPAISVTEKDGVYDFGTIPQGTPVTHNFTLKNTGKTPLVLSNVGVTCGCTTPEWPKEPIGPSETSSIKVRFDTKNKSGPQVKTITVYANTEPAYSELRLRGIVNAVPKPEVKN